MTGLGLGGTGLGPYYSFLGPYNNSCGQSVTGLGLGGSGNIYLRVGECTIKGCRPELVVLDHGTPPPPSRSFTRPLAYSYPLQSSSITVLRPLHLHNLHWCPQTSPTRRQARPHAGPGPVAAGSARQGGLGRRERRRSLQRSASDGATRTKRIERRDSFRRRGRRDEEFRWRGRRQLVARAAAGISRPKRVGTIKRVGAVGTGPRRAANRLMRSIAAGTTGAAGTGPRSAANRRLRLPALLPLSS